MTLTLADILTVVSIGVMISGAVFSIFTYFDKRKNTQLLEKGTAADYTNDMSESIATVYKQAKEALKDKADAEIAHKKEIADLRQEFNVALEAQRTETGKQKLANDLLRSEVALLRLEISKIAYEISLVAQLGDEPVVEKVTIKRIVVIPEAAK
jgi:hypothetical protein